MFQHLNIKYNHILLFFFSAIFLVSIELSFWVILAYIITPDTLAIPTNTFNIIDNLNLGYFFIALVILRFVISNLHTWIIHFIAFNYLERLRVLLTERIMQSSFESFMEIGKGKAISNIVTNSAVYVDTIILNSMKIFSDFLQFLSISLAVIFVTGFESVKAIIALSFLAFIGIFSLKGYFLSWSKTIVKLTNNLNKSSDYLLYGLKEININNLYNYISITNKAIFTNISKIQTYIRYAQIAPRYFVEAIFYIFIGIFIYSNISIDNPTIESLSSISFFLIAGMRVMPIINQMMIAYNGIKAGQGPMNQLSEDLSALKELRKHTYLSIPNSDKNPLIEFKNVKYSYNTEDVIKNLSFEFFRGEIVIFKGKSGSGKTTAIDLLLELRLPKDGRITFQDNLKHFYISQHPFYPSCTIKEYFEMICPGEKWENVSKILSMFGLDQFSLNPDYQIGEAGSNLSGGQRQMIAITSAMIIKPDVLVLDESTSGLDDSSEKVFLEILENHFKNSLVVFVSHRPESKSIATKIIEFPS